MMLMGFGFTSAIMWGSNTIKGKLDVWQINRAAARHRRGEL